MKACDVRAAMRALDRRLSVCEQIEHLENQETEVHILIYDDETGEEIGLLDGFEDVMQTAREAMLRKLHGVRDEIDGILTGLGVTGFDEPVNLDDDDDDDDGAE